MDEPREELTVKVGDKEVSFKSVYLNTVATVLTLIIVSVIGVFLYEHNARAVEYQQSQNDVLKELLQAHREQNCLIAIPEAQREAKVEFCKRITR